MLLNAGFVDGRGFTSPAQRSNETGEIAEKRPRLELPRLPPSATRVIPRLVCPIVGCPQSQWAGWDTFAPLVRHIDRSHLSRGVKPPQAFLVETKHFICPTCNTLCPEYKDCSLCGQVTGPEVMPSPVPPHPIPEESRRDYAQPFQPPATDEAELREL